MRRGHASATYAPGYRLLCTRSGYKSARYEALLAHFGRVMAKREEPAAANWIGSWGLVAPATVAITIVAVGAVAIAVIRPVIAIAVIWSVIAVAIIRVAITVPIIRVTITVVATAIGATILSSPIANLFNCAIAFRLKWQSSVTLHHCRLSFPAKSANSYKYRRGRHTSEEGAHGASGALGASLQPRIRFTVPHLNDKARAPLMDE